MTCMSKSHAKFLFAALLTSLLWGNGIAEASNVATTARIEVQGASKIEVISTQYPSQLVYVASALSPRIVVESANSVSTLGLSKPEIPEQVFSAVTPRITVEGANSVDILKLEPPVSLVKSTTTTPSSPSLNPPLSTSTPTPVLPPPASIPPPAPNPKPGEVSVYLYGQKTDVNIDEDIVLNLSAVNLITKPTMTVQLILKVPSGMSITATEFVKGGGGQYTASYDVEPGGFRQIEVHIMTNQAGSFNVIGDLCYYFGGDKAAASYQQISLPVMVRTVPQQQPQPTPSPKKGGGLSCSSPAQGATTSSPIDLASGWALIGLCWGGIGTASILRKIQKKKQKRD